MDSRIFILLWDRIQYNVSFPVPVVPLLATGGFFSLLSYVPLAGIYPLLCVFILWFISLFSISLLSGTTTCSRLIYFLHTFQNLPFLQEGLFFKWRMELETKIWMQVSLLQLRCGCFEVFLTVEKKYVGTNLLLLISRYVQLCKPMYCSMPGFPVLHHLPECAQTLCIR